MTGTALTSADASYGDLRFGDPESVRDSPLTQNAMASRTTTITALPLSDYRIERCCRQDITAFAVQHR